GRLCSLRRRTATSGNDDINLPLNEFPRQRRQAVIPAFCPTKIDLYILAFNVANFLETLSEGHDSAVNREGRYTAEETDRGHCRLLRAHYQRIRSPRAKKGNKLPPPHSSIRCVVVQGEEDITTRPSWHRILHCNWSSRP